MREEAKYAGMAQATRRLMESFNQALCVPLFHGKPLAQHLARGARSSKNLRSDQSGSASYNCHSCAWLSSESEQGTPADGPIQTNCRCIGKT